MRIGKSWREWIGISGLVFVLIGPAGASENPAVAEGEIQTDVEAFKAKLLKQRGLQAGYGSASSIDQALVEIKREPTVREVQEAALQNFRVNTDQVNSLRSRASTKALAPVLEISGGYAASDMNEETDHYEYNFVRSLTGSPWIARGADGTGYDVRAKLSWNFPQLIFNAEELDVASLAGLVEGLLKESTRLYFMRRRLQVEMILSPPKDRASLLTKELRLEELTGLIDAMTGGWFQKELDRLAQVQGSP